MKKHLVDVEKHEVPSDHKPMCDMEYREICVITRVPPRMHNYAGEVVMRVIPTSGFVVMSLSSQTVWSSRNDMQDIMVRPYKGDTLTLKLE
jgi:hypothetical protein